MHKDLDAELFLHFPRQRLRLGLALLDVAAGQVPDIGVPLTQGAAVAEQDSTGCHKNACYDVMHRRSASPPYNRDSTASACPVTDRHTAPSDGDPADRRVAVPVTFDSKPFDAPPSLLEAWAMDELMDVRVRFAVDDQALSDLHSRAFGYAATSWKSWQQRLERHSLTWIGVFVRGSLVGFVHACWDGGSHAFALDTVVDPTYQRRGIGRLLVQTLAAQAAAAGCEWLHVDYEPHLDMFYRRACGFRATDAGLLILGR